MKGADDMAYIEPETTVQFLNVPFDPDYENTMYWSTVSEQESYMETKVLLTIGKNSYQRKTRGVIRVGWTADLQTPVNNVIRALYNANYMRYKNTNYENKWFYAFVKQVEYVNNNTVDVRYEIDVMQTWACDYSLLECFIERQHTITDDVGEHTVPEGLEHGEYYSEPCDANNYTTNGIFNYTPVICLVTTFDENGDYAPGQVIGGQSSQGDIFSGLHYSFFGLNDIQSLNDKLEALSGVKVIEESGVKIPQFLADGVVSLFMVPSYFAQAYGSTAPSVLLGFDIRKGGSYLLGNYRPRNKKLMCYPYNMLYVSNNQGNDAELRWEDFATPLSAQIQIWGNLSPNGGMTCAPMSYKGASGIRNNDELMQLTGFPLCSWTYDSFKAWLAQNGGTITAGAIGIVGKWAEIVATGGVGALIGGQGNPQPYTQVGQHQQYETTASYNPIASTGGISGALAATLGAVGMLFDHSRKPPQAKGNGNSSLAYQSGILTFSFYRKRIKEEYAKIIDAYFDMYGYKVNMVGVPNRNARPCYTFIKTIGCAVDGALPADDAKAIQAIFDKGIRFWKSSATFGVYSPLVNNNEVTIVG